MAQPNSSLEGTTKTGLRWFNFPGYVDHGLISAAVLIPPNRRLVATSGHVGSRGGQGDPPKDLEEEMTNAFNDVEKSIKAVDPSLTSDEIWASIYQVSTFHADGMGKDAIETLISVGNRYFKDHRPAWTTVEVKSLVRGVRFEIHVQAALP